MIGLPVDLRQPDGARLRHARRTARAVERERDRPLSTSRTSCSSAFRAPREDDPRAVP